ncbi:MAG TPA: hypothetical protein VKI65_18630, partial [Gemmataceae bacterium]|nr:hypothetical protein [Gemmataceae bacterium]
MLVIIGRYAAPWGRADRLPGLAVVVCALFWPVVRVSAQPAADASLFITVQNPLTSDEMSRVKDVTERARQHHQRERERRLKIVYDFNPDNKPSGTSLFGPCSDLADYLVNLHDVTTIAFVHNEVARHTVLPVLACAEIVMSSEGKLGDVTHDPGPIPAKYLREYEDIARKRGRAPAIVVKMLDPKLEVFQGKRADKSDAYVNKAEDAKKEGIVALNAAAVVAAGELGLFDYDKARK